MIHTVEKVIIRLPLLDVLRFVRQDGRNLLRMKGSILSLSLRDYGFAGDGCGGGDSADEGHVGRHSGDAQQLRAGLSPGPSVTASQPGRSLGLVQEHMSAVILLLACTTRSGVPAWHTTHTVGYSMNAEHCERSDRS